MKVFFYVAPTISFKQKILPQCRDCNQDHQYIFSNNEVHFYNVLISKCIFFFTLDTAAILCNIYFCIGTIFFLFCS